MRSESLQIVSVGLLVFTQDKRFRVREEEGVWELRVEKVVGEDGGKYECQVTHSQGMEVQLFKLVVVKKEEKTAEKDDYVPQLKAMNDDPVQTVQKHPEKVTNEQSLSIERLTEKSMKRNQSKSVGESDYMTELLVPVMSLVTISIVILILGTVRTIMQNQSEITKHHSRASVHQSRTSLNRNRTISKQ